MARTRIYFVSDVHSSERCWLKFLAAPKFYEADTVIVGGDITGKFIVPIRVIPPSGVPWRSDAASPEIGRYLAGMLVDRIGEILGREFPPRGAAEDPAPLAMDGAGEGAPHGG